MPFIILLLTLITTNNVSTRSSRSISDVYQCSYIYALRRLKVRKMIRSLVILLLPLTDCGYGCQSYLVRLLTYMPGTMISKVPLTPELLYETGKTAAKMDKILQKVK